MSGRRSVIDVNELGKPRVYDGTGARWQHWSTTMTRFMDLSDVLLASKRNYG